MPRRTRRFAIALFAATAALPSRAPATVKTTWESRVTALQSAEIPDAELAAPH